MKDIKTSGLFLYLKKLILEHSKDGLYFMNIALGTPEEVLDALRSEGVGYQLNGSGVILLLWKPSSKVLKDDQVAPSLT